MSAIIQFQNVTFRYPDASADSLCGITLDIEEGRFTAILGHNGSGKSTLARHMNGLLLPTAGRVLVDGENTADEDRLLGIRQKVGMVFQNPDNQIVSNVVEEDVAFAPENLGVPSSEIRARVDDALNLVGMYEFRNHAPHLLSGGQKQRVAVAGALAMRPRVLVLDEPTAMLDPRGRAELLEIVTGLCRNQGMTVVLITHHMDECIDADRLVVMSDGKIAMEGSPAELFSRADELQHEGLDVPETVRLLHDLNLHGFRVKETALKPDECARVIADAIQVRRPLWQS